MCLYFTEERCHAGKNCVLIGHHKPSIGGPVLETSCSCFPDSFSYTNAQLINHPPNGQLPNVTNIDFNWTSYMQHCYPLAGSRTMTTPSIDNIKKEISKVM